MLGLRCCGGTWRWKHPTAGNLELEVWKEVGAETTVSGDKDLAVSPGCKLAPEGREWSKRRQKFGKGACLRRRKRRHHEL